MSWEEVRTKGVACPCGQGKIEQREYMDDWNQIEYSTPTIEKGLAIGRHALTASKEIAVSA